MRRPRITIGAAVLAPAVGVHAGFEPHVGAGVPRDDCPGGVAVELGRQLGPVLFFAGLDGNELNVKRFETIRRITRHSSAAVELARLGTFVFVVGDRRVRNPAGAAFSCFVRLRHITCSYEHVALSNREGRDSNQLAHPRSDDKMQRRQNTEGWSSG